MTGHRFLANLAALEVGVQAGLEAIRSRFPGRTIVILTALAEGADTFVVRVALKDPSNLVRFVLPMPTESYLESFSSDEARMEFRRLFRPEAAAFLNQSSADAFAALRDFLIERADALLALYDGCPAQGPGGTAEVVKGMRSKGKPVVVVRAGNRRPGTFEPTSLGALQGTLVLYGF